MQSPSSTRGMPLLLALLCATGPLGIDMYLPCFPQMAADLGSTEGTIQLSLMTFFAGLMLGQLAYGPLSDRFGRKPLIVVGMAVCVLGSAGCALAADIGRLLWLRLLAGLGGSIGMVIAFAIIKDVYHGPQIGRMMSMVLAVLGLCPVLAPLAGNALEAAFSWRAIFWALAIWGVAVTALMLVALPETRTLQARAGYRLSRTFHTYLDILRDRRFTPPVISLYVAQAGFFAYLAGSSTVFISHYGFSPTAFSLLFAFNALGVIAAAIATPRLHARLGLARTYRLVNTAGFAVMAVLALAMLAGLGHVALVCAGLFLAVAMLGVLMPTGSQLSLLHQRKLAGTASALMGSMQFGAGAAISAVTGVLAHLGGLGLVAVMAACAAFGSLMCWWILPRAEPEAPSHH